MFALVDGNNFYVSCERVFRPALNGHPVIVLSNNDGCAIARSDEAKALGVKMGQPYFQIRDKLPNADIIALSANFVLYGDMSNRLMGTAAGLGPEQEIYSIDECFIGLHNVPGDITKRAQSMRTRLAHWIGIPCGIGIGATKTLAKIGNYIAKTAARKPGSYPTDLAGVCNLASLPQSDVDALFKATPVGEVWGIGPRISAQLQAKGISTVLDVVRLPPATVRSLFSVMLERTVRELQGEPCISLEAAANKIQIACTRSFGHPVTELQVLREAVTEFVSRAAEKLRAQGSNARQVLVFIHTSPFRKQDKQYASSMTVPVVRPLADTVSMLHAALFGLGVIFKPGYRYAKAGVILLDLSDDNVQQGELDFGEEEAVPGAGLMNAVDTINTKYGKGTVRLGSAGAQTVKRQWEMKQLLRTPQYTTSWNDVPIALA